MDTTAGAEAGIRDELLERFFRYVGIESQSNAAATELPSTPGQLKLAVLLAQELQELVLKMCLSTTMQSSRR